MSEETLAELTALAQEFTANRRSYETSGPPAAASAFGLAGVIVGRRIEAGYPTRPEVRAGRASEELHQLKKEFLSLQGEHERLLGRASKMKVWLVCYHVAGGAALTATTTNPRQFWSGLLFLVGLAAMLFWTTEEK